MSDEQTTAAPDFDLDCVPVRSSATAWQWVEDEMVVLDLGGRKLQGLNPVAGRIWELCEQDRTAREIAKLLTVEFEVEAATAADDVRQFLGALAAQGLIAVADATRQDRR